MAPDTTVSQEALMAVPTGRMERRLPKELVVQLSRPDVPLLQEPATTQNVSAGGVRLVTQRIWRPGDLVVLSSPEKRLGTQARVVYCQRLGNKWFAVGLKLLAPVEDWRNPP